MRKEQTPERIEALVEQYPFLGPVVGEWVTNDGTYSANIRVERMDEGLMFFRPDVADGSTGGFFLGSGPNENLVGTMRASAFVVLRGSLTRPEDSWEWKSDLKETVRDLLRRYSLRLDTVAYLVYVREMRWHDTLPNWTERTPPRPFGEFKRAERIVTVYRPPQARKGGLKGLYEGASFSRHAQLSTREFIDGVIQEKPEYISANKEIEALIDRFVSSVYNQGLRSRIDQSRVKGMSGIFGNVKLMSYAMAGRVMLTFRREDVDVSFLAAEDGPPRMDLQSLSGTLPQVRDIVQTVIDVFENDNGLSMPYAYLKDDKKVGIG